LHACIAIGRNAETARILIAQGADVNMEQAGGYTPLHLAASSGLVEIAKLLLETGANPKTPCHRGKTPADYARERNHEAVVQLLA
jgi:uncharacterized protein